MVERTPRSSAEPPPIADSLRQLSGSLTRTGFGVLNSVVRPLVRRGLGSPLPLGVGTVLLATTGRQSGELREVPLLSARLGDSLVVSTVRTRSNWIRNAEVSPTVRVWVDGIERTGVAEVHHLPRLDVAVVRLEPAGR
jgi:hypothetical protein